MDFRDSEGPLSTAMVTFLITSIILLGLVAIAIFLWQKPTNRTETAELPLSGSRGLFDVPTDTQITSSLDEQTADLLSRAARGDKDSLLQARDIHDPALYADALTRLVGQATTDPTLLSLVSYVTRHQLPVNETLALALMESWKKAPDRSSTAKMLHVAALSDDAKIYQIAVDLALRFWREGKTSDLPAIELLALLTGEFWVLSSGTRSSGAGFLLKRTLSSARHELETTKTI